MLNEAHYQDRFHGLRQRKDSLQTQFESIGDRRLLPQGFGPVKAGSSQGTSPADPGAGRRVRNEAVNLAMSRANHFGQYSYGT